MIDDAYRAKLRETASALGVSPIDLATVISYETGGTFDPAQPGPRTKWGRHRGLIQFGEPQAQQYGVDWERPLESQLGANGAVVRYLTDRGFQRGGSLLDMYSTINAGAPGLYDRSDETAGGMPGTVRDKVETQFGPHRARAMEVLRVADAQFDPEKFRAVLGGSGRSAATASAPAATGGAAEFDPEKFRAVLNGGRAQPETEAQPDGGFMGRAEAVGRGALQGATLGFSDEIAGGTIDRKTYQERYIALRREGVPHAEAEKQARQEGFGAAEARTQEVRDANKASQAQHPGYYMAGEVAGGVASSAIPVGGAVGAATRAASLGGKMARGAASGAATGAAVGAVDGFGRGEGGVDERLSSAGDGAMMGAGFGAVVGAAAPAIGAGVRRVVENVRSRPNMEAARRMGTTSEAAEVTARMIANDDPAQAAANIARGGDGAMLADAGEATGGLLDTAMQKAGAGGAIGRRAIEDRAIAAADDVRGALDAALGPVTAPSRPNTGRLGSVYDAAYRTPIDYSGERGRALEGLLPRIPGDIINRANRLMQVSGEKSKQIMAEIADDGTVTFTEMPDVRQLDYITRALNDVAKRGDGQGALGGNTAEGRAYGNLAREIRSILKEEVPAYKAALNVAATEIGQKEARELGEVALRQQTTRGDLFEAVSDMGAIEKRKLQEGVRSHIDDVLARVKRTQGSSETETREAWEAIKALSSREAGDKLAMIVGKSEAKALLTKLDRASTAFELRARAARGSQTFGRQSMDEAMKARLDPGAMGKLLEMSPAAAARRLGQSFTGMTPQARQEAEEAFAGEIVRLLTTSRGAAAQKQAQELVRMLDRSTETARIAKIVERRVTQGAGAVGFAAGTRLTAE